MLQEQVVCADLSLIPHLPASKQQHKIINIGNTTGNLKWYMKYFIYWTAGVKSSKLWSSQLWMQFMELRIEAWKAQDFNGLDSNLNPVEVLAFSGFYTQLHKLQS